MDYKVLIILHLFYVELWEEFKKKLLNLDSEFDLIVSLCEDIEDFERQILKTFPNAKIIRLPNKGLDIGPFLKVLKYLKENYLEYDYLVKLHTKKSHYDESLGTAWRTELVNSIVGDKETFKNNLDLLDRTSNKMCGSQKWCFLIGTARYKDAFKLPRLDDTANFIGGTMFIVDYNVLLSSFTIDDLDILYNLMPVGYVRDHSIAHHMERILAFVVQNKGYKVIGV